MVSGRARSSRDADTGEPPRRSLAALGRALGGGLVVVMLALVGAAQALAEVTGAADNLRTGWYREQPTLTPGLLESGKFHQIFNSHLEGRIYAQPLIANGTLLVVTEQDWAYGLDPITGKVRWETPVGTPVEALKAPIECEDLAPFLGITGTPVIDTEHNVAYFTSNSYEGGTGGPITWYMNAVKLDNGEEVKPFPVKIEGTAQNIKGETVTFEAAQQLQRPALLMMNGVVYAGFGGHCDNPPYET